MFARSDAAQLAELIARVDAGDLQIEVAKRRPQAGLAAVHDEAAAERLAGKTVLTPRPPQPGPGSRRVSHRLRMPPEFCALRRANVEPGINGSHDEAGPPRDGSTAPSSRLAAGPGVLHSGGVVRVWRGSQIVP
jgi:hypothetical protein